MLRPSFFRADVAVALILLHLHVAHAATAAKQPNLGKKRCRASPPPTHGHFHDPCNRFVCSLQHGSGAHPLLVCLCLAPRPKCVRPSLSAFPLLRSVPPSLPRSLAASLPRSLAPRSQTLCLPRTLSASPTTYHHLPPLPTRSLLAPRLLYGPPTRSRPVCSSLPAG